MIARGLSLSAASVALWGLAVSTSEAHGSIAGVGPFYGGVLHPWAVPAHLLAIVAAGLLGGQQGWTFVARTLPGWLLASAAGLAFATDAVSGAAQIGMIVASCVTGVLVATATRIPERLVVGGTALMAFVVALDSPPDPGSLGDRAAMVAGTVLAIGLLYAWVAAPLARLPAGWPAIGLRVLGAWIGAVSILNLALTLFGHPVVA